MSLTVIISPTHVLPMASTAPTLKDDVTGAYAFRRKLTRPLARWEIVIPGTKDRIDPLLGLLDYAQGDTPMLFDGGGLIEITEPILMAVGTGNITDYRLPHKNVLVASTVIYLNNAPTNAWSPLGSPDGVYMDMIRFTSAPFSGYQVKAKYRRMAKVVRDTESEVELNRLHRNQSDPAKSPYQVRLVLMEVPT